MTQNREETNGVSSRARVRRMAPQGEHMVMTMRIRTCFDSADTFIAGFCRLFTETTCFVPTRARREPGEETTFSLRLADGTPMLRGSCRVLSAWTEDTSPYQCAGLELDLLRLTPPSV